MDKNGVERKLAGAPFSSDLIQWQQKLNDALQNGAPRQSMTYAVKIRFLVNIFDQNMDV